MYNPAHEIIAAYGVILKRLHYENIELVRQWRNSDPVQRWMEFRDEITPEMQKKWFASLDPSAQFYYIIEFEGQYIGLVNIKNVKDNTGEGGIFIADEKKQNGTVAVQAILAMYDFGFNMLGLHEITAHIRADNPRAIRFNHAIGFRKALGQENVATQIWRLDPMEWQSRTASIRAYLQPKPFCQA